MKSLFLLAAACALATPATGHAADAGSTVKHVVAGKAYKSAAAALDSGHDQWVEDIIAITQIPSPPFKEQVRAKAFADMLRQRGLEASIDEEGNGLALR